MKATEQYFPVVLFVILNNVESVDQWNPITTTVTLLLVWYFLHNPKSDPGEDCLNE